MAAVVAETEALIMERVNRSLELRQTDELPPENIFSRMSLLLKEQDLFNQASFIVGDAAEYAEKECSLYIKWLNSSFFNGENDEQLSIAPIVDGINFKGEAAFSSEVLTALSSACLADPPLAKLLSEGGSVERARSLSPTMQLFDRFVKRFFFMSNRDEDVSGLRWIENDATPFALLCGQVKGLVQQRKKESKTLQEAVDACSALLDEPPRFVQSRETDSSRQGLDLVLNAISKHMKSDTDYHLERFKSAASALRQLLHLKEVIRKNKKGKKNISSLTRVQTSFIVSTTSIFVVPFVSLFLQQIWQARSTVSTRQRFCQLTLFSA